MLHCNCTQEIQLALKDSTNVYCYYNIIHEIIQDVPSDTYPITEIVNWPTSIVWILSISQVLLFASIEWKSISWTWWLHAALRNRYSGCPAKRPTSRNVFSIIGIFPSCRPVDIDVTIFDFFSFISHFLFCFFVCWMFVGSFHELFVQNEKKRMFRHLMYVFWSG